MLETAGWAIWLLGVAAAFMVGAYGYGQHGNILSGSICATLVGIASVLFYRECRT